MQNAICDICHVRPATTAVSVFDHGVRKTINVCDFDYQRLQTTQARRTMLESLFDMDPFQHFTYTQESDLFTPEDDIQQAEALARDYLEISKFFSEQTTDIFKEAGNVAEGFNRNEVDTEHVLYAALGNPLVVKLLAKLGTNADDIKAYIDTNVAQGTLSDEASLAADLTISPRVKDVLERAFQASRDLGSSYIGPEHILIGLAEEDDGLGGITLRKFGVDPTALRDAINLLQKTPAKAPRVILNVPTLAKYTRDLTELAEQGKLDPVIGRTDEISTLIEVLSRRTKNNPVLIGEAGVGKTAIVEGLAQRIVNGDVPEHLLTKRVYEVSVNSLVAGTKYRGEFEERLETLINEVIANKEHLILFVDELHMIVGAGAGGEGETGDVSNIIKPYLARGDINLIGATTLGEYTKYIEKDAALERRFQPILVAEPTVEETIEILRGLRDKYEAFHKVRITDRAIVSAAELSDRYIKNRLLPDKAIDLVDQASARSRISSGVFSAEIKRLNSDIERLGMEEDFAATYGNYDEAEKIRDKLDKLRERRDEINAQWETERGTTSVDVTEEDIATVVSKLTGIPVTQLTQEERAKLMQLETAIQQKIIGQEKAVTAVARAIRRSRAGLLASTRPIAVFMFLGPTGVGKTELAKALARVMFGDDKALIRIDMSEYKESHTISKLIGSPPGYIGYEESGYLTEKVRRSPYSVILLDELEKAHPDVHNLLLQIFDEGRLTDSKGRTVDFTNTIIIATSNLGSEYIQKYGKVTEELQKQVNDFLANVFRPEFLNRIDEVIIFHSLSKEQIRQIVDLRLSEVCEVLEGQGLTVDFTDELKDYLAEQGYDPRFGARELNRIIQAQVMDVLAETLLSGKVDPQKVQKLQIDYSDEQGKVVVEGL